MDGIFGRRDQSLLAVHRLPLVFYPDFTNRTNKAEQYARAVSGIEVAEKVRVLPVFLKYLRLAADRQDEGLKLYRAAALRSPASKRTGPCGKSSWPSRFSGCC